MGVTVERNGGVTVNADRYAPKKVKEIGVERLLQWAYAVEKVRGAPSWGSGGVGVGWGETAEAAGSGCHPDALVVDRVVTLLSESSAHLVRDNALACTRPDWRPKAQHRFEPKIVTDKPAPAASAFPWLGGAIWAHREDCACGGHAYDCTARKPLFYHDSWGPAGAGVACVPIVERDNPADVSAFRMTWYVPWVSCLEVIRDALSAQRDGLTLVAHRLTDALPPLTPWLSKNPLDGEIRRS